ncbi:MAG: SIMPL domain-containing protein [Nocardioides sp.]|nr:SIMPL domain-containing protein [Nocardioides sp.]
MNGNVTVGVRGLLVAALVAMALVVAYLLGGSGGGTPAAQAADDGGAAQAERPRLLTMTGTGEAGAVPDQLSFGLGVTLTRADLDDALAAANATMGRVLGALAKYDVARSDVQTTRLPGLGAGLGPGQGARPGWRGRQRRRPGRRRRRPGERHPAAGRRHRRGPGEGAGRRRGGGDRQGAAVRRGLRPDARGRGQAPRGARPAAALAVPAVRVRGAGSRGDGPERRADPRRAGPDRRHRPGRLGAGLTASRSGFGAWAPSR